MCFDKGLLSIASRSDGGRNITLSSLSTLPKSDSAAEIFKRSLWLELKIRCTKGSDVE
jgi:hypothetical protein